MNQKSITPDLGVKALAELELSDWQFMLDQIKESSGDEDSILFAQRQVARLKSEVSGQPGSPDTHVRSATHGDEPAFPLEVEFEGLTKREYMAVQLHAALITNNTGYLIAANQACQAADALIKSLNSFGK